ncbi:GyrI-like domain-containing protein [Paenibacillus piri]|uniref:AraC family transcriptional regulator n=1 Tax=Paenibacillus piri TaxID=2547395 RepID=A0A4R5KI31_9BACL|nr:GyrI-like domain-containing protein [Paenibacillus piri]TDF95036.1 AraC family transcriptional regulator [Paenibacillus piri]
MKLEMMDKPSVVQLFGFSKTHAADKSYSEDVMELIGQVWREVHEHRLSTTGINYVAYEDGDVLFAGVELAAEPDRPTSLMKKRFSFSRYARFIHIGPYSGLDEAHSSIRAALQASGHRYCQPTMEIYGHWNEDSAKNETEIRYTLV